MHRVARVVLTFAGLAFVEAGVAKLADAPDLGSGAARHRGSSPLPGTSTRVSEVAGDRARWRRAVAERPRARGVFESKMRHDFE